ncbi:hypothetical protein LCGC14_2563010, partial [marine sediment metagenome]
MGKYRTKTIINIESKKFEKAVDDFTANLDGKIKQIVLYSAPESKVSFEDDDGNKGYVYYNHYEAIIIYKSAKHVIRSIRAKEKAV